MAKPDVAADETMTRAVEFNPGLATLLSSVAAVAQLPFATPGGHHGR